MNRPLWPPIAALACTALGAAALAGCGGDDPDQVLSDTAKKLRELRSGELSMRMTIAAGGGGAGVGDAGGAGDVGFALRGPFELARRGGMPRARIAYTQIAGPRRATVTITTTGRRAFVMAGGRTRELSASQARRLRLGSGGAGKQLSIGSWVRDPEVENGPDVDGVATQRVTAKLDVRAAASDLLRVAGALGPDAGALGRSSGEVERAVRDSSFELLTGRDDRLLRRLRLGMELASGGQEAKVAFALGVRRPNQPVRIAAP